MLSPDVGVPIDCTVATLRLGPLNSTCEPAVGALAAVQFVGVDQLLSVAPVQVKVAAPAREAAMPISGRTACANRARTCCPVARRRRAGTEVTNPMCTSPISPRQQ